MSDINNIKPLQNPQKNVEFRLNAYGYFLTYPQCPLTKEDAATQLQLLGQVVSGVVAEEKHEDGSPHLHAYLRFMKKLNVRKPEFFDLKGPDNAIYHGNY